MQGHLKNKKDDNLKQMTLKEFMNNSKNKPKEKSNERELKDEAACNDLAQEPDEKSRPATVRETFNLKCHLKEYIHTAIKDNDQKWMSLRKIDNKWLDAITGLNKSQAYIIKSLENIVTSYTESHLNKFLEIHSQQKNNDIGATNTAVQEQCQSIEKLWKTMGFLVWNKTTWFSNDKKA